MKYQNVMHYKAKKTPMQMYLLLILPLYRHILRQLIAARRSEDFINLYATWVCCNAAIFYLLKKNLMAYRNDWNSVAHQKYIFCQPNKKIGIILIDLQKIKILVITYLFWSKVTFLKKSLWVAYTWHIRISGTKI